MEIPRVLKVTRVTADTNSSRLNRVSSMNHGGHQNQKVDDEMRAFAVDVISENPLYTLSNPMKNCKDDCRKNLILA